MKNTSIMEILYCVTNIYCTRAQTNVNKNRNTSYIIKF